jgi:diguanylate cyclase (GGDEF)-like protein
MADTCASCGATLSDQLGLPLKHRFQKDIHDSFSRSMPAVILVDLDGFKAVNDTRGHEAGDRCLAEVVAILRREVGETARLYRAGGDEFAVLVDQADRQLVTALAEAMRSAIDHGKPAGGDPRVTASIGAACQADVRAANAEELSRYADEAVYVSKLLRGKNHVTLAPIPKEDSLCVRGKREAVRFTTANRGLMLRVHENSEALRQICFHTDRLYQIWIQAAKGQAANAAIVDIDRAKEHLRHSTNAYEEIFLMLGHIFDPEQCASSGAAYDLRNPVLHAREYVQKVVRRFVTNDEFRRLSTNVRQFQKREGRASEELSALAQMCENLDVETEELRFAASRDTVGPRPSLAAFMDQVIKVELLAEKVSGVTAELLPDLRSVPSV